MMLEFQITKSGRGYLTKSGHSPAISILTVTSLEIDNCVVRDNVGHAFQLKGNKHKKPHRLILKGNILKRNQACDVVNRSISPNEPPCCKECPASCSLHDVGGETKDDGRLLVRGRYCFNCGSPTQKICSHCKNAFYCNIQCQLEDWNKRHRYYCVK